jgi:hypothetical protein
LSLYYDAMLFFKNGTTRIFLTTLLFYTTLGGTNHHPGNKRYRKMVEDQKLNYVNCKRLDKPLVALEIIRTWRSQDPPGRFLKIDEKTGLWNDVGDKKAREKTSRTYIQRITFTYILPHYKNCNAWTFGQSGSQARKLYIVSHIYSFFVTILQKLCVKRHRKFDCSNKKREMDLIMVPMTR